MGELLTALGLAADHLARGFDRSTSALSQRRAARLESLADPTGRGRQSALFAWTESRRRYEPSNEARSLLLLSMLERLNGNGRRALLLGREALQVAKIAGATSASGLALLALAQVEQSPPLLRLARLLATCPAIWDLGPSAVTDCQLLAMKAAWDSGQVELGLDLFRSVASRTTGNPILELELAAASVSLLQGAGRTAEAAEVAALGARAAHSLAQSQLEAHYLLRLSGLRRILGDLAGARQAARMAIEIAPEEETPIMARAWGELAAVASAMGDEALAAQLFARAEALSSSVPDPALEALRLRRALAGGDVTLGAAAPADSPLLGKPPEGARSAPATIIELALRGHLSEGRGDLEGAWQEYRRALELFSAWLVEIEDPIVRTHLMDTWRQMSRRAATVALALGRAAWALDALELGKQTPSLEQQSSVWSELARHLPHSTVVVTYVVSHDGVWAVVMRSGDLEGVRLPIQTETLRQQVGLWRVAATRHAPGELWWRIGERLSEALLGPLENRGHFANADLIYVVPDDALHLIPLASLPRPGAVDELYGDHHIWARVPSLRVLDATWHQSPRSGSWVAFGPDGGADTVAELRSALSNRVGSFRLGPRASEIAWRRATKEASVLHFAGHAVIPSPDLEGGGLRLRADGMADGRLSIGEILDSDLHGATIVLLGCDTAMRPVDAAHGDGAGELPSLSEAFLLAGARSVVGNLWPVTERVGRDLAVIFYAHGGPANGARSLALAKRELRRRWPDRPDWWAGAVWEGFAGPAVAPASE
jgi:CHAT domain-containing protein